MENRVLFLVIDVDNKKINKDTEKSIKSNLGKEDSLVFINYDNKNYDEKYYLLKDKINTLINDVNNFDYVCVIPNNSLVTGNIKKIFMEYQTDRVDDIKEIYLPMSIYNYGENKCTILNKSVWNSSMATVAGVMDIELALYQVDATIFGAFIPTDLFFNKEYYKDGLKYYQQYYLLNHLADGMNLILGIPKIIMNDIKWDFLLENVSNEEKVNNFNLAREDWKTKELKKA